MHYLVGAFFGGGRCSASATKAAEVLLAFFEIDQTDLVDEDTSSLASTLAKSAEAIGRLSAKQPRADD